MHERDDFVAAIFERRFDARGIVGHTPFAFENGHVRVLSLRHLTDAIAEIAVDTTENAISGLQHVRDTHLHSRGPRPGRRLGQVVFRLEHHARSPAIGPPLLSSTRASISIAMPPMLLRESG